jgi:hypothetical protein
MLKGIFACIQSLRQMMQPYKHIRRKNINLFYVIVIVNQQLRLCK